MKIGVLTSSRADYGIYYPLLQAMNADPCIELFIIAFGTHLSGQYGHTATQIRNDGFEISLSVDTLPEGDSPMTISQAMGKTIVNFSKVWIDNSFDIVLALGDRYEMFAACASTVPFAIPIAHIHGGETTLGAIDDSLRHCITHMSAIHFTTTRQYRDRVIALKGSDKNVYNVGALSIDNLKSLTLLSIEAFKERFGIDLDIPSILITFHPETVAFEKNREYVAELIKALKEIKTYQLIITMPNADTMGNLVRKEIQQFIAGAPNAIKVESFGVLGYLTCMKYCAMMLGNTSSGFVEAAFFPKYVINIGERQSGRVITENIFNCPIKKDAIIRAVKNYEQIKLPPSIDIYGDGTTASKIISTLKQFCN